MNTKKWSVVVSALLMLVAIILIGAGASGWFVTGGQQPRADSSAKAVEETKTILIPTEGMSCGACAARVKRALKGIDGVAKVEIDLEHRNIRVRYIEGKVSPERLGVTINQLGYRAGTPVAAENRAGAAGKIKAVRIPITGMVCEEMCVPKVKEALAAIDGVTKVEVSLKQANAWVEYAADKVSPGQMVSVINGLGFKAGTPIPEALR